MCGTTTEGRSEFLNAQISWLLAKDVWWEGALPCVPRGRFWNKMACLGARTCSRHGDRVRSTGRELVPVGAGCERTVRAEAREHNRGAGWNAMVLAMNAACENHRRAASERLAWCGEGWASLLVTLNGTRVLTRPRKPVSRRRASRGPGPRPSRGSHLSTFGGAGLAVCEGERFWVRWLHPRALKRRLWCEGSRSRKLNACARVLGLVCCVLQ